MAEHSLGAGITVRPVEEADLAAVVALYADDRLGASRETPDDLGPYRAALARMRTQPGNTAYLIERDGQAVSTLTLTIVPGISRTATTRATLEAVRVAPSERGTGLGTRLVEWACEEAARQGATLVQLTTDVSRTDAHRFYERLGFRQTHLGFKRDLRA
ncbi:MAG: GNAT family N-acetyltransferase [Micrococcales bacterium]|nr:GNAT family N-acetyltransferase [Micrococcales bacterium]